ncbi:penicillin-binding protein 1A [Flavilitoribacter nigricans]|nr:transglycosylase domain-containing protein [Flavilitoribacter nigricans]
MNTQLRKFGTSIRSFLRPYRQKWQGFAEKKPRLAKFIKWTGVSIICLFFAFWLFIFIISLTVPTARQLRQLQTDVASEIYTADSVLIGRYYDQYRLLVPYDSIPDFVIDALVATEDERFYEHRGIDYRSWGRVLYRSVLMGDRSGGGGSTISQQLAKNLLPRKDFFLLSLLVNKSREIVTATRLERVYNKKQLLALYLNTVSFPDNMFGIDVAAQRFFSKSAASLSPEEGALLVGTLKGTSFYHPVRNEERALQRRNVVFQQMAKNQYITEAERDSLMETPLNLVYNREVQSEGLAPYFREYVKRQIEEMLANMENPDGDPYDLYTDGLKIYTTLDAGLQHEAEEAIREHLTAVQNEFNQHWKGYTAPWHDVNTIDFAMRNSLYYQQLKAQNLNDEEIVEKFNEKDTLTIFTWDGAREEVMSPLDRIKYHLGLLQVGFLSMEPETGFIRAWVGGIDYDFFQYDHVRAKRQSGSVFKPVVYTQALRSGINPCQQIDNRLRVYHEYAKYDWGIKDYRRDDPEPHFDTDGTDLDDWIPQNADGKYGGSYSMEGALTNSVNTITVDLIMRIGVDSVIQLARDMGITGDIPQEPSIALGAASMSVYDLTRAFAILANKGKMVHPRVISQILDHEGNVLVDFSEQVPQEQVIEPETAAVITKMLESVSTMGTAARLRWKYRLYGFPIAGKTGTSQNHADGWFIGYTPKLVSGVWVGGDSPLVRFRNFENGQGAATALPVWALYMQDILRKAEYEEWQGGEFPELSPEQRQRLGCPMRIKSPEEMLADSIAQARQDSLDQLVIDSLQVETLPPLEPNDPTDLGNR